MASEYGNAPLHIKNRIRDALLAGGLYNITKKSMGKGIVGLVLPVAALLIEDLTNPKGVVIPFFRWILSRHGKVTIVEMSATPLRKAESTSPRINK